jgi:hypothetical protein
MHSEPYRLVRRKLTLLHENYTRARREPRNPARNQGRGWCPQGLYAVVPPGGVPPTCSAWAGEAPWLDVTAHEEPGRGPFT